MWYELGSGKLSVRRKSANSILLSLLLPDSQKAMIKFLFPAYPNGFLLLFSHSQQIYRVLVPAFPSNLVFVSLDSQFLVINATFVFSISSFCHRTVIRVNGTQVEDKMRRFKGECAQFSFNKCPIYTHDCASAKFSTNSQETDNSAVSTFLSAILTSSP